MKEEAYAAFLVLPFSTHPDAATTTPVAHGTPASATPAKPIMSLFVRTVNRRASGMLLAILLIHVPAKRRRGKFEWFDVPSAGFVHVPKNEARMAQRRRRAGDAIDHRERAPPSGRPTHWIARLTPSSSAMANAPPMSLPCVQLEYPRVRRGPTSDWARNGSTSEKCSV
ncbi:MAG: hypothetical protein ACREIA_13210 [Opitutaceae bacterium]